MILKRIMLKNIRSYENQEIEFPTGSTLLSGDIGSGKTSVLLGIEFAFFGLQPGQRGASLLRNGKNHGGVEMVFEVEGREVMIERTLKRGKTVSQDYCAIIIDGIKSEISVTELKNRVLELLNYPKEFSKKQNLLYKFTVYTPQEEMKEIILQDQETRVNTLRHVFGIDKYKRILENISVVISKIREEKRVKEELTSNLEQDKDFIVSKENELESKESNLVSIEKELFLKTETRKRVQEEKNDVLKNVEEKNKLQSEIEKTKIMISNKNEAILGNKKLIEKLKEQIEELKELEFDEAQIKRIEEEAKEKKNEKEKLDEGILDINSQIAYLRSKNEENDKLEKQISNLENCPTCLQEVDAIYRANVLNKLHNDLSTNNKRLKSLEVEKKEVSEKIKEISVEISSMEMKLTDLKILRVRLQGIQEKQARLREIEESHIPLRKDIDLLEKHIEALNRSVFELKKFDNIFELKKEELEEALKQERIVEIKVAELKKEIEVFSLQIEELKERIKRAKEIKGQLIYLSELEGWLVKEFIPVVSLIERNVMIKLKVEFTELFAKWFSMLVSDSFNVQLSDDFTPVVEYQDYEIDYTYLSGGERTAIALAYRLSLNQVINSLLSKIKTRGFVILDEPTDGFSDQQLDKMRDVLQELEFDQLIIVSHEQKIESFVENVLKFSKERGISFIDE